MNKNIYIVITSILIIFLGCNQTLTFKKFNFVHKGNPANEMKLFLPQAYSYLQVSFYFNTEQPLINFQYLNGYIQIEEILFDFKREFIDILVKEMETNYNIVLEENGVEHELKDYWNLEHRDQYYNKNNNFCYFFRFERSFEEKIKKELIKKNNSQVKVNFNFNITVGEEDMAIILNEDFIFIVEEEKYKISELEFH